MKGTGNHRLLTGGGIVGSIPTSSLFRAEQSAGGGIGTSLLSSPIYREGHVLFITGNDVIARLSRLKGVRYQKSADVISSEITLWTPIQALGGEELDFLR